MSKRVQLESGVKHVCNGQIRNVMHEAGYWYLSSRKTGLLHTKDLKARHKFCQKNSSYWVNSRILENRHFILFGY